MIRIDEEFIGLTSAKAKNSSRKRMNYNFHATADDTMHRMLNAMEPETYIQPHKHENPDKVEAFFCLRGRLLVVEFDDYGNITDHIVLSNKSGNYGCEIAARSWHSIISLEAGSVAYEVKDGPWNPADDKHFAPWAPKEGDTGCEAFNAGILSSLKIAIY